jgi:hypothetical protein
MHFSKLSLHILQFGKYWVEYQDGATAMIPQHGHSVTEMNGTHIHLEVAFYCFNEVESSVESLHCPW